jgi:competence protein ComEC
MLRKFNNLRFLSRDMNPKRNIATAWHRFWGRLPWLWIRFPMVFVLAVGVASIAMQETLGNRFRNAMVGLLLATGCTLIGMRIWRRPISSRLILLSLTLALGSLVCHLHSLAQQRASERLSHWRELIAEHAGESPMISHVYRPVACRGVIDNAFRYRKAMLIGSDPTQPELGWQSLTVLQVRQVRIGGQWIDRSLLVPLTIDGKLLGYYPGDSVELYGQWKLPSRPANPGQFDQAKRYAELGYSAQAKAESESQLIRIPTIERVRMDRYLGMLSEHALRWIERYVVLGQSELTAALVLGQREQAEWRLQEELLATGSIHMLSISGMHIEMLAMSLLLLGTIWQIPRKPLLLGVCVLVIGYAQLCGSNPPVARAAMMLAGLCVARWFGWSFSSLNFLAAAGVALLLYRTGVIFEAGTQLSFLAVAVLILSSNGANRVQAPLEKLLATRSSHWLRGLRHLGAWSREMIRTSFWVWFVTAPLVWSSFHVVSPIAIALNLLLWLPMLLALVSGLGLVIAGWMPLLAWPLGAICGLSLWTVQFIVGWSEQIPLGHFWLRAPPLWWVYGFYILGIATAMFVGVKKTRSRKRLMGILGAWFMVGLGLQPASDWWERLRSPQRDRLCVTFIDVGHGTNIVLETPDRETWLYDAGRMGDHQRSYQVMVDALWAMNTPRIDTLVLSHADADHYNGVEGIAKRFAIRRVLSTRQVFEHSSPLLQSNLQALSRHRTERIVWKKGDYHDGASWHLLALHPPESGVDGSDNANSLCVMLEFAGRRVLLPGDLEPPGMKMLVAHAPTQVDVLMAPHHGSLNSRSEALLTWCKPKLIVISGAQRATTDRVLASFAGEDRQVLVTARDHAIRIEILRTGEVHTMRWEIDRWMPIPKREPTETSDP